MKELLCTNNVVLISYVKDVLGQSGIKPLVFDENFSILDGSIGMIPRRIMIGDDEFDEARRILIQIGLSNELKDTMSGKGVNQWGKEGKIGDGVCKTLPK